MSAIITDNKITIDITPDKLKAYLRFETDAECNDITELDIFNILKENNIAITDSLKGKVSELVTLLHSGTVPKEPVLIAEGTPPVEPIDQQFEWDSALQNSNDIPDDEETSVNFYQRHKLVTVDTGQKIGKIIKGQEGKEGIDIFGKPINIRTQPANVKLGENVKLDDDGQTVVAQQAGQAIYQRNKIFVKDVLEIKGDVDFETGNVESASNVLVWGTVKDLFIVKSKQDISVYRLVESAYLFAQENIRIVGGIKGRNKAIIEAGGDINVKFAEYAYLEAGGNIEIAKEVIDSIILCTGTLNVENGAIIGGQAFACQGINVKTLGSPAGVKTIVGVASNPNILNELFTLEQINSETQKTIEKIRQTVAPLLKQMKRLTPEQREKATELMYRADELESENQKREERKQQLLQHMPDPTSVTLFVSTKILPNTEIRIGNRFAVIKQEILGPVKITLKKIQNVTEMVQTNQLSGSVYTLTSRKLDIENIEIPQKPKIIQPGYEETQQQTQEPNTDDNNNDSDTQ